MSLINLKNDRKKTKSNPGISYKLEPDQISLNWEHVYFQNPGHWK